LNYAVLRFVLFLLGSPLAAHLMAANLPGVLFKIFTTYNYTKQ